jgi:hypothetical protein
MSVFLDDHPLATTELDQPRTVGEALELARTEAAANGSLILGLLCNNEQVPPDRLSWVLSQPADDFERVDLVSGPPKPVVLKALRDVSGLFAQTFPLVKEASETIAAGRVGEAMRAFADCVSVWGSAHESIVQGAALLGVRFDDLQLCGRPVTQWLVELATKLGEIKEAIEARDHVLLGDILRYELDEPLREWEQMLAAFIGHVEQLAEPAPAEERGKGEIRHRSPGQHAGSKITS